MSKMEGGGCFEATFGQLPKPIPFFSDDFPNAAHSQVQDSWPGPGAAQATTSQPGGEAAPA